MSRNINTHGNGKLPYGSVSANTVLCYILPVLFEKGINNECPIINATHLTLEIELEKLICNPELRHSLGRESRKYVEKFHDADILSKSLYDIYSKEFIKNY